MVRRQDADHGNAYARLTYPLSDMRRLCSLMVVVKAVQCDQLGTQEVEVVHNLVTTIPRGKLVFLEIKFSGYCSSAPAYGLEPVSGRLSVLERDLLMDHFSSLRAVSLTLPSGGSNSTSRWTDAFKTGLSQLEKRGLLSLTDPRGKFIHCIHQRFNDRLYMIIVCSDQSTYNESFDTSNTGDVERIVFSPDSRWIAALCESTCTILLWDIAARTMACKWRSAGTSNLAFSPDSHLLALSGPYDLTLFYIPSGEKLRHFSLLIDDDYPDYD